MTVELSDSGGDAAGTGPEIASSVPAVEAGPSRETDLPYESRSQARDWAEPPEDTGGEGLPETPASPAGDSAVDGGETRQAHFEHIEATEAAPAQPSELDLPPAEANSGEETSSEADGGNEASSQDLDEMDRDLAAEAHKRELGHDPATGRYRPAEAQTAVRVEELKGVELARSADPRVDWRDAKSGETYDAVGNFPAKHFDKQWPNLQTKIADHLEKADYVPVDVSQFTPEQRQIVREFIDDNGLGPRAFLVGQ